MNSRALSLGLLLFASSAADDDEYDTDADGSDGGHCPASPSTGVPTMPGMRSQSVALSVGIESPEKRAK
jgi:hypothetical protein